MGGMFAQAANFNRNVARWNVLRVTDFRTTWLTTGALSDCNRKALYTNWNTPAFLTVWPTFNDMATCTIGSVCTTCITNGNVGTAATSWVTDEACANTTYGSIGDWNTAAVRSMASLFASRDKCAALGTNQTRFNADISKWNVVSVSTMAEMFSGAAAFDRPIGSWSTASVTSMASMFAGAAAFDRPIGSWNVVSVTSMAGMFAGASAFDQPIGGWSTSSVANMNGMFRDASKFNQPIGGWNVAAVSDMGVLFSNARAFGQDVAAWNVQSVASMTGRAPPVCRCARAGPSFALLLEFMSSTICPQWRRMQVPLTRRSSVYPALSTASGARRCKRPTQRLEQHASATRSIWSGT
jgi:hypothetical protein